MDFEAHDRTLPFDGPEKIDTAVLETFAYEYAGKDQDITHETREFTSVCPYSGLPDFATISITYVPDKVCLELRSLKYYLQSYRNIGIFYEHLSNRILEDLVACCQPKKLTLRCEFTTRGGFQSTIMAQYPR